MAILFALPERVVIIMNKSRILVLAMAAVFTVLFVSGCSNHANENRTPTVIAPLTNDELAYFNGNDFFNGELLNIRNQFLSSLYSFPEEIDLFELFYCGNGYAESVTNEEIVAALALCGWDAADCDLEKNSRANMDAVLTQHMGLSLADTNGIGLEKMTYLVGYDAYYYFHGDTNYRMSVTFINGERIGNVIELYYEDTFYGGENKVLTLREVDGNYFFVSNKLLLEANCGTP
jgi:hypothetical protein